MKKYLDIFSARQESAIPRKRFRDIARKAVANCGTILKLKTFSGILKKLLVASAVLLVVFLSSAVIYWREGGKYNYNKNNPSDNNSNKQGSNEAQERMLNLNSAENKNSAGDSFSQKYLYFMRNENGRQTVYKKRLNADSEEQSIFDFISQKNAGLNIQSLNIRPNAAISAKNNLIAYADSQGLSTYDLNAKNSRQIIKKTSESVVNLGISPKWSINMAGVYNIQFPQWSEDGRFISFVKVYSDKLAPGIFDIKTNRYYSLENYGEIELSGANLKWSAANNGVILPEFGRNAQSGLYFLNAKNFNRPVDIGKKVIDGEADFYEAVFSPDGGRIGFTYKKDYLNDNNVLAVADSTGGNFKKLDEDEEKLFIFFSQDGQYLYFVNDFEGNSLLSQINIESGEKNDIAVLPEDFNFWNNHAWMGDGILMLSGKILQPAENVSQTKKGVIMILDLNKNELVYSYLYNGNEEFLGILDN